MHPRYVKMLAGMKDDGGTDWYVYILRCSDGTLYTGITKDLKARVLAHNAGRGGAYTRTHRPVRLLYSEQGYCRAAALRREAGIKRLPRPRKVRLALGNACQPPRLKQPARASKHEPLNTHAKRSSL